MEQRCKIYLNRGVRHTSNLTHITFRKVHKPDSQFCIHWVRWREVYVTRLFGHWRTLPERFFMQSFGRLNYPCSRAKRYELRVKCHIRDNVKEFFLSITRDDQLTRNRNIGRQIRLFWRTKTAVARDTFALYSTKMMLKMTKESSQTSVFGKLQTPVMGKARSSKEVGLS